MRRSPHAAALAAGTLAVAIMATHAEPLHAQTDPAARAVRFGIGGGVALPVGNFKNGVDLAAVKQDFEQGFAGQAFAEFRAPGTPLGFRAAVALNRFQAGDVRLTRSGTSSPLAVETPDGHSQILSGLANVTLQLPAGPIRPYVLAGLGAFSLKNTANVAVAPGGGSLVEAGDQSTTSFGINGGAGVLLRLGRIEGFVEARLTNVYTSDGRFANLKNVQFIPVTLGLSF